ncbi:MAG: ATP phosphoribosyltransferase [Lewinellaceae bacterium]|nr:ATP phosphoribosyltransferase [Lewinellaceae bacterium]
MLKIAIQKSGRLYEDSVALLKACSIGISNGGGRLRSVASNFPLEAYFLRDDDIPQYVEDGVADCGIVGENVVFEKNKKVSVEEPMGFGKCRLSLAVPKANYFGGIGSLQGARIATSYPHLLRTFLAKNNVEADIHEISGSVEITTGIGLADCICDLVSTGSTLISNGLREVQTILESQAVMIASENLEAGKREILDKLLFRMRAVNRSKNHKYILLNAPDDKLADIIRILPGMKSPTVLPLAASGWSSVHSVVQEDRFWEVIEDLKANGAEGILVVPIEKMVV